MVRKLTAWIAGLTIAMLMMAVVLAGAAHAQGLLPPAALVGHWTGALKTPTGHDLQIFLNVTTNSASVDVPDQGGFAAPVAGLTLTGSTVSFETPTLRAKWAGTLAADGQSMTGTLTQGVSLPLTLKRFAMNRPQTPKPPFPYRVVDVEVQSTPDVKLAGSLTLPPGKGPFPAAVMITGSGQQDRDETVFDHKPFAVIADALARRGVAVLRLDDRGAGGSTGSFGSATMDDFAIDVRAAVKTLRARKDIAPGRVGLIGHSEGGMIGPMVAADDPKIAFVVLLAGPGVPFTQLIAAQRAAIGDAVGADAKQMAANEAIVARAEAIAAAAKDSADAEAQIKAAFAGKGLPPAALDQIARQVGSPGMRSMLADDPRPALAKLRMPVLALIGSKDLQVPAAQNIPALKADLKDNPKATVTELPDINHLFQDTKTGLISGYILSEQTMSPRALDLMVDWVVANAGR